MSKCIISKLIDIFDTGFITLLPNKLHAFTAS